MNITALTKTPPKAVAYSVVSSNGNMLVEDGASVHTQKLKLIPVPVHFFEKNEENWYWLFIII